MQEFQNNINITQTDSSKLNISIKTVFQSTPILVQIQELRKLKYMIDNYPNSDPIYQQEILSQQKTMISVLKEQILRLQGQLNQTQKERDQKQILYEEALSEIDNLKEKVATLKQNNQSLLQTLQVFQREYIKRDYSTTLNIPGMGKKKSLTDGPFFMQLIRNMKTKFNESDLEVLKIPERSYLGQYYGFSFHNEIEPQQTSLYNQSIPPNKYRPSKIRTYGRKNFFNEKFRHFFWCNIIENRQKITRKLYDFLQDKIGGNKQNTIRCPSIIDMDLRRMDFKLEEEQSKSMAIQLKKCLEMFRVYRPDIDYVQGMSYIAWMLLIRIQNYHAFRCFTNIMLGDPFIHSLYVFKGKDIKKIISFYEECLEDKRPKLSKYMKKLEVQSQLFIIEWAYTFYSRAFSIRIVSKIWDLWFSEDYNVFFKVAMVILEMLQNDIMSQKQNDKIIEVIRTQTHKLDEQDFLARLLKQRLFQDLRLENTPKNK